MQEVAASLREDDAAWNAERRSERSAAAESGAEPGGDRGALAFLASLFKKFEDPWG